jgi:hypothetical protein
MSPEISRGERFGGSDLNFPLPLECDVVGVVRWLGLVR